MSVSSTPTAIPKLRWIRILPPCMLSYVMAFLDRLNIGYAIAGGMNQALGMTAAVAGLAAGVFSFGYLLLQVPCGHYAAKHSAKTVVAFILVAWGAVAIGMGFSQNPTQLVIARFLLGVAEGGLWPAVFVLISDWFPSAELARANALFALGNAIASVINGPLSGWLVANYGWRWLFYIEGAFPFVAMVIWVALITDHPAEAKWLSSAERDYLVTTIAAEQQALKKSAPKAASYGELLKQRNLWILIATYFCFQIAVTAYGTWLPTILRQLTRTGIARVGQLAVAPYILQVLGVYTFAFWSDRSGNRRLFTALPALGFAACLFLSVQTKQMIWVSYGFLTVTGFFLTGHQGVFWSMPPAIFPREIGGGARGIINGMGNLGGFFGPAMVGWFMTIFRSSDRGIYGMAISLVLACVFIYSLPKNLSKIARKQAARPPGMSVTAR